MSTRHFDPVGGLRGELRAPPDKSISHRAALVGAMGEGRTRVEGYLDAGDTRSTLAAVRALGAEVKLVGSSTPASRADSGHRGRAARVDRAPGASGPLPTAIDVEIEGIGLRGPGSRFVGDEVEIDVGNAGTLLRILPGWLAGQDQGRWRLDGDESIRKRAVDRVAVPLREMGAEVECREGCLPPLRIAGAGLHGITYELPVASAQVKSCLLIAGLLARGGTEVLEPAPTRDHTERMLRAAGVEVSSEERTRLPTSMPPKRISVGPTERIEPGTIKVPGDFSSAAFPLVASLIVPGSRIAITGVGLNPTRIGLLGVLNRMGASATADQGEPAGLEPQGTIVSGHGPLQGVRVAAHEAALTIDELPLIALAGCFAEGDTIITGAAELRRKESDRIGAVAEGLRALGATIEELPDGLAVTGTEGLRGGRFDSRGDHRLAMLGIVAGLGSREGVEVVGVEAAEISYPHLAADLASLAGGAPE